MVKNYVGIHIAKVMRPRWKQNYFFFPVGSYPAIHIWLVWADDRIVRNWVRSISQIWINVFIPAVVADLQI